MTQHIRFWYLLALKSNKAQARQSFHGSHKQCMPIDSDQNLDPLPHWIRHDWHLPEACEHMQ